MRKGFMLVEELDSTKIQTLGGDVLRKALPNYVKANTAEVNRQLSQGKSPNRDFYEKLFETNEECRSCLIDYLSHYGEALPMGCKGVQDKWCILKSEDENYADISMPLSSFKFLANAKAFTIRKLTVLEEKELCDVELTGLEELTLDGFKNNSSKFLPRFIKDNEGSLRRLSGVPYSLLPHLPPLQLDFFSLTYRKKTFSLENCPVEATHFEVDISRCAIPMAFLADIKAENVRIKARNLFEEYQYVPANAMIKSVHLTYKEKADCNFTELFRQLPEYLPQLEKVDVVYEVCTNSQKIRYAQFQEEEKWKAPIAALQKVLNGIDVPLKVTFTFRVWFKRLMSLEWHLEEPTRPADFPECQLTQDIPEWMKNEHYAKAKPADCHFFSKTWDVQGLGRMHSVSFECLVITDHEEKEVFGRSGWNTVYGDNVYGDMLRAKLAQKF